MKNPIITEELSVKKSEDLQQAFIPDKPLKVDPPKSGAKNGRERDRGVEVYMETVRQRSAVRDKQQLTTELFQRQQRLPEPIVTLPDMDTQEEPADTEDTNVGLPSVRKLLARFENSQDGDNTETTTQARSKSRIVKSNSIHGGDVRANLEQLKGEAMPKDPVTRKIWRPLMQNCLLTSPWEGLTVLLQNRFCTCR